MRKVLIVIDMQNDFIDAALGTKEAAAIVDAVKDKIRSYPSENIIATMDTHLVLPRLLVFCGLSVMLSV